jgi:hypothetical protein
MHHCEALAGPLIGSRAGRIFAAIRKPPHSITATRRQNRARALSTIPEHHYYG